MGALRKQRRWLRKLWVVLRDVEWAWWLLNDMNHRRLEAERLCKELGLPERVTFLHRGQLPLRDALNLAEGYGITLHDGKAGFACRAELAKDKWKNSISPDAPVESYSGWLIKDPEETTAISAWSSWPEIAIGQCLVNAKKAGVI